MPSGRSRCARRPRSSKPSSLSPDTGRRTPWTGSSGPCRSRPMRLPPPAPPPGSGPAPGPGPTGGARRPLRLGAAERLVQVPQDVLHVLDADRDADQLGPDARGPQLLVAQLLVGRRTGVDDQLLGVPHVGQVAEQLDRLDEPLAGGPSALDAEREDRAGAL